jgi:hypothetical protein
MNNQEAADELQYAIELIKQDGKDWLDERDIPVLEMAISALQEKDSPKPTAESVQNVQNEDLILRKAAIDALWEIRQEEISDGRRFHDYCSLSTAVDVIKDLPSAQPESEERKAESAQNVPIEDLISRKAAIDAINKALDRETLLNSFVRKVAVDALKTMPPAQPEIIRCKECRWRKDQSGSAAWLPCRAIVTPSDFYCGRAERTGEQDG